MNEKGRATFSEVNLLGLALLFRDSNAIIRSMKPAALLCLNSAMRSQPNIAESKLSNAESTPIRYDIISSRAWICYSILVDP